VCRNKVEEMRLRNRKNPLCLFDLFVLFRESFAFWLPKSSVG
jgi:hypothetical protein